MKNLEERSPILNSKTPSLEVVVSETGDRIFNLTHTIYPIVGQKDIYILGSTSEYRFIRIEGNITHQIDMTHYNNLSNPSGESCIMVGKRGSKKCFVRIEGNKIQETLDEGTVNRKHLFDNYTPTLYQSGRGQPFVLEEDLNWLTIYEY